MDSQNPFNADAMLMMAWHADADLNVNWVNSALANWMHENSREDLLQRIADKTLTIEQLLHSLLTKDQASQSVSSIGKTIHELLSLEKEAMHAWPDKARESSSEDHPYDGWMAIRLRTPVNDQRFFLSGIRAFSPGGFRLQSHSHFQEQDRVDLVAVLDVTVVGGKPVLHGFQGQFQEAWLRVYSTMREGTRTATMALLGRSMSHNIGSHALWHLESSLERRKYNNDELRHFIGYVRERSELIAGYATGLPKLRTVRSLIDLLKTFQLNKIIRQGIAKSERVDEVNLLYFEEGNPYSLDCAEMRPRGEMSDTPIAQVCLPCGVMSQHALFMLLENIIRDAAKYRADKAPIQRLDVSVKSTLYNKDFWRINILISAEQDESFVQVVQKELETLRFAYHDGQMIPGHLGVKERFIAAAHLRGLQPADCFPPPSFNGPIYLGGSQDPKILWIESLQKQPEWQFYLPVPKLILFIDLDKKGGDNTNEMTYASLDSKDLSYEIARHAAIVLSHSAAQSIKSPEARDALPVGTFAQVPMPDDPAGRTFIPFIGKLQSSINMVDLQRAHLKQIIQTRKSSFPLLVLNDSGLVEPGQIQQISTEPTVVFSNLSSVKNLATVFASVNQENRPLCVFWSHMPKEIALRHEIVDFDLKSFALDRSSNSAKIDDDGKQIQVAHLEFHDHGDLLRGIIDSRHFRSLTEGNATAGQLREFEELSLSLLIAASQKILIVDERLDALMHPQQSKMSFEASLFRLKGVVFASVVTDDSSASWGTFWGKLKERIECGCYAFVVLHLGIAEKVADCGALGNGHREERLSRARVHIEALGPRVIFHSARTTINVPGCLVPYSTVADWVNNNQPKLRIIQDLVQSRREERI